MIAGGCCAGGVHGYCADVRHLDSWAAHSIVPGASFVRCAG